MKLISEVVEHVRPIVAEAVGGGKSYAIEGPFLQSEIENRNGRVYPFAILEREVARYTTDYILQDRALGELGHPDSPHINLDRVSHKITELRAEGTDFIGKARILDTPFGKIVKAFIDEGVKLGVSSRGVGSISSGVGGVDVVGDDFFLATAADIVADPSAPEAFVRGLREGHEWVWENGNLSQAAIAQLQRGIAKSVVKNKTDRRRVEARVFEDFMRQLSRNTRIL